MGTLHQVSYFYRFSPFVVTTWQSYRGGKLALQYCRVVRVLYVDVAKRTYRCGEENIWHLRGLVGAARTTKAVHRNVLWGGGITFCLLKNVSMALDLHLHLSTYFFFFGSWKTRDEKKSLMKVGNLVTYQLNLCIVRAAPSTQKKTPMFMKYGNAHQENN